MANRGSKNVSIPFMPLFQYLDTSIVVSLSNALLFMPNLQTFRWIGYGPFLDETVAECIPPNLKSFIVQSWVFLFY